MATNYSEVVRPKKSKNTWDAYDDDLIEIIKNKKLFIEIPFDLHKEIKTRAADRGINMKKYVLRAVIDRIKKEQTEGNI